MENKEKVTWGTIFGVASCLFGAHAGGVLPAAIRAMNFFVQYGWPAIFTPIIAMVVLAFVYRVIIIMCNQHQVSNYNAWSHKLYEPYDKVLSPLYEICNLGAGILATSASVAGAAAIINEMFHLPYMVCVIVLTAAIVVLSMFGAGLIAKASSVLVVLIVASCVIISVCGLAANGGHIIQDIQSNYAPRGIVYPIWKSLTYSSFQIFSLLGTFGVAMQLKQRKTATKQRYLVLSSMPEHCCC